jgi:acetyltransferase-like isoleucine patch superfamily enzyme
MNNLMFKLVSHFCSPAKRTEYYKKNNYIQMGYGCEIHSNVLFGSEPYLVRLGNQVRIASGVKFVTHDGGMWVVRNLGWNQYADKMGRIIIKDNVFIGFDAIIMPDVEIGSNVIIGAGSVVTKDIPDNMVVAGIPARVVCSIEEYYDKNISKIDTTKQMTRKEKEVYYTQKFNMNM